MSQTESLRLSAEVADKFTGPLGALKKQLADLANAGTGHTDTLEKGFGKVTGGMRAAEQAAMSGLNPALKTVGITSLTATGAILGVAAAMRSFVSGSASLGQMSRDTGIAAETLRNFGAVAGKFNVEQGAVAQGAQTFADKMRTFSQGHGDLWKFIMQQGRSAEGRKHFQDFAADLAKTKDTGDQLRKALEEMENIKDPRERRIFAQEFFGNADIARLADGTLGKLKDVWEKTAGKLGPLDPKAVESAERFERSMADLASTMRKVGTTIGQEVLPYAERFTTWLDAIVSDQRGDAMKAIRESLAGVKRELDQINWAQFGADSLAVLKESTALAGTLANALHRVAEAIHAIRDGKYGEAVRGLDGANGPLARKMFPMPGDDLLNKQDRAEQIKRQLENFDASEKGGTSSERSREQAEKLRHELGKLTDEIKALRQQNGATAQKSSYGGSDGGGDGIGGSAGIGALIQKASYGGGGSGGSGGGTLGERLFGHPTGSNALGDPHKMDRFRAFLENRGYRGALGGPGGFGGSDIGDGMRGRPFGAPAGNAGAAEAGRALRGGGRPFGGKLNLRDADPEVVKYIEDEARKRGIDPNTALAVADGEGLRGFRPDRAVKGDGGTSHGPFQMHYAGGTGGNRQRGLGDDFTRATGLDARDPATFREQIRFSLDHATKHGWGAWYGRAHHGIGVWDGIGGRPGFAGDAGNGTGDLRLKSREATAGGPSAAGLTGFLRDLQAGDLPGGFDRVTALNDAYHHRVNPGSMHTRGLAGDVTLRDPRYSAEAADAIRERLRGAGLDPSSYRVIDEYRNPSGHATGGHLHVQFADGDAAERYRAYAEAAQKRRLAEIGDGITQTKPWSKAGGAGSFADRQEQERERRRGLQLTGAARSGLRAAAGAGPGITADGRVNIAVHTKDPDTKVNSSASGNLFREIVQSRGRQMAAAGGE